MASASKAARSFDERHKVSDKTKQAATSTLQRAGEMNQKHQITDKTVAAACVGAKKLSSGFKSISRSVKSG